MPVHIDYQVQYEVCALLFLTLISIRFFTMRRFPNLPNRLFGVILVCAVVDLSLDIVGAFTIINVASLPAWVNYAVNTSFYSMQVIFPALVLSYVIYAAGKRYYKNPGLACVLLPAAIVAAMLTFNYFTGWFFSVQIIEGVQAYCRGPLFLVMYCETILYMVASVILVATFHSILDMRQRKTIIGFIVFELIAIVIQYIFPQVLITGVALSLALTMMYFTIQNPEDMLDVISGVFNYNAMMTFLDSAISRGERLRLIVIDVGGIRRVNSAYGLSAGNRIFSEIGFYLNGLGREYWAFRMIGTRFMLATLRDNDFRFVVTSVNDRFDRGWVIDDLKFDLPATVRYYDDAELFKSAEEVISLVDVAYANMDAAFWGHCMHIGKDVMVLSRRRTLIEDAIRDALHSGKGFSLCYQPIYHVKSGRYACAEALLRLSSATLGEISPAEFIPIAEKSGLILQIDEFVIRSACSFLKQSLKPDYLELNLSAAEFSRDPSGRIQNLLRECGADPSRICFEVTETAAISHPGNLADFMCGMICQGYRFALDDFGTGFANITQVASLPFSVAKIDKILLADDVKTRTLFEALVNMFNRIGISTVVEGVETLVQADRVSELADHIQGFYYAKPMPTEEYLAFLKENY